MLSFSCSGLSWAPGMTVAALLRALTAIHQPEQFTFKGDLCQWSNPSSIKFGVDKFALREKASFLRDSVFAANDGIITTFAVVAGSLGASLSPRIILILGTANLFADGIAMASGNYLGVKSEEEFEEAEDKIGKYYHSPLPHALITFTSFVIAGLIPLVPYLLHLAEGFYVAMFLVFLSLFLIGSVRTKFTKKKWFTGGIEMVFVGGFAAGVAYLTGFLVDRYLV